MKPSRRSTQSIESARPLRVSFPNMSVLHPCHHSLGSVSALGSHTSNTINEIIQQIGKGEKGKKMPIFCKPPPPSRSISLSLCCFLQYPPLVVGYKALLPWKCKRLCQHWLGWTWWKQPKDGPSADLPTLCLKILPWLDLTTQHRRVVE